MTTSSQRAVTIEDGSHGFSSLVLALPSEMSSKSLARIARFAVGDLTGEVSEGRDSLWTIIRRPQLGGLVIRLAFAPGGITAVKQLRPKPDETYRSRNTPTR